MKDIFIILDSDAFNDAIQMTEKFVNEGISVNFVKLDGKDPNDLGYKSNDNSNRQLTTNGL